MNGLLKLWVKFKNLFKQGLTSQQLALSITISVVVSLFPIFGIATIVLAALALKLKANLPIMIMVSYLIEPLKVLLFVPFINLGTELFGAEHILLTFEAIKSSYAISFFDTVKDLSFELLCGFAGWSVSVLPLSVLFYFVLNLSLKFFAELIKNNQPQ